MRAPASRNGGETDVEVIPVLAAVICAEGRYLLGRRPEGKRHAGLWEFPGGKMLPGEDYLAAARRELAEELELDAVATGDVLFSSADEGSPFVIHFVATDVLGTPTLREHSELGWFTPREMADLPLAPSDARFARPLRAA